MHQESGGGGGVETEVTMVPAAVLIYTKPRRACAAGTILSVWSDEEMGQIEATQWK